MPMPRSFLRLNDFAAALLEFGVVRERQRLVEDRREVAGVIGGADRGLVRDRLARDQVAPAQPHRIDAGDARGLVDQALQRVVRLRPSGAAIRAGRHRVGEHALHADLDARDRVHAGEAAREILVWMCAPGTPMNAPMLAMCFTRSARNLPFWSIASSASVTVSRACWSERKDSERVAIQATGRPVSFAATSSARIFRVDRGLQPERAADILGDDAQLLPRQSHHGDELVALRPAPCEQERSV